MGRKSGKNGGSSSINGRRAKIGNAQSSGKTLNGGGGSGGSGSSDSSGSSGRTTTFTVAAAILIALASVLAGIRARGTVELNAETSTALKQQAGAGNSGRASTNGRSKNAAGEEAVASTLLAPPPHPEPVFEDDGSEYASTYSVRKCTCLQSGPALCTFAPPPHFLQRQPTTTTTIAN